MIINHNIAALVTNNALAKANSKADTASKRLSTGYKINTAADDAAGMAISNKLKTEIRNLQMANRNTNDAVSLVQTAEGGLSEATNAIQRLRELGVEGANGNLTDSDRTKIQAEVDQLVEEIDGICEKIQFNNKDILGQDKTYRFQVGAREGLYIDFDMYAVTATSVGVDGLKGTGYTTADGCENAIEVCDKALDYINKYRAGLGSLQNRLEYASESLSTADTNTQESLSRIIDTDMAEEMANYTQYNVITQAGISMLAQANERPNQLLSLLQ